MASTRSPTLIEARWAGEPGFMSVTTNAPCDEPGLELKNGSLNKLRNNFSATHH